MAWIDFKHLKSTVSFIPVLEYYGIELKRTSGTHLTGACPLPSHAGDRTNKNAFHVDIEKGAFNCFTHCGGVPRGKSFVNTTRLVDTGIYAVVRHPQYTGGVYSIFLTTLLWYPHWLFGVLGVMGTVVVYMSCKVEDQYLIEKFSDDYAAYMKKTPGMNIFLGLVRLLRCRK